MWVLKHKTQTGNTIVEVMIALAIIGVIIAGAYGTANRSIRITQQAQERTRASKIAEQQIELLRSFVSGGSDESAAIFAASDYFCIADSELISETEEQIVAFSGNIPDNEQEAELTSGPPDGVYPDNCVQQNFYHISVSRDNDSGRFTTLVRWDRLGGGVDEVRFVYGISQGN